MGNEQVASLEREKEFLWNRLLLFRHGKLADVLGFQLRYTATTLRIVNKLLQHPQTKKGRVHRRPMCHLYLSRMSCPWLPNWMNYAILSSMLIYILSTSVLRSRGLKATFMTMWLRWRATISSDHPLRQNRDRTWRSVRIYQEYDKVCSCRRFRRSFFPGVVDSN